MNKLFYITVMASIAVLASYRSATANPDNNMFPPAGQSNATMGESISYANYVTPTYDNLARAYWALSIHDLDDDVAIDNFLAITECHIYESYYKNEFEWAKIRGLSKKYLEQNRRYFSTRFVSVQPIMLNRYDMEEGAFELMPDSRYVGAKRLQISGNDHLKSPCPGVRFNVPNYPHNVVLTARRPFTLKSIAVPAEIAREYVDYMTKNNIEQEEGRPAYLVIRSNLKQYAGTTRDAGQLFASVHGDIESITVYGDKDLTLKLYENVYLTAKGSMSTEKQSAKEGGIAESGDNPNPGGEKK